MTTQHIDTTDPHPAAEAQLGRLREAITTAVRLGPTFLAGSVDAVAMANTMLGAVRTYVAAEHTDGRDGSPVGPESKQLYPVLQELVACGGGFLAGRCDAACVGRTMTELVHEFPPAVS